MACDCASVVGNGSNNFDMAWTGLFFRFSPGKLTRILINLQLVQSKARVLISCNVICKTVLGR